MPATLTHRINMLCGADLAAFRARLCSLAQRDVYADGLESAVTTMPRLPSLLTEGSSVDILGFGTCAGYGPPQLTLSVAMLLDYPRWPQEVFWDEAHAWAEAVAGPSMAVAGISGSRENEDGMVFHYRLKVTEPAAASAPRPPIRQPAGTAAVIRPSTITASTSWDGVPVAHATGRPRLGASRSAAVTPSRSS
ncbi:hypothetical protein QE394_001651 [Arthrobacter sp. SORGH_AS 212]|nr:hypothetical protein [Arthrobacter sp. SORGH_AS_0212]